MYLNLWVYNIIVSPQNQTKKVINLNKRRIVLIYSREISGKQVRVTDVIAYYQ